MRLISKQISELRAYAKDRKGELAKLVNDAADTIETLSTKLSAANLERSSRYYNGGWIPCSERLPENGHYYLWCSDMGSVQSDYYWNGFENGKKYGYNIVAWMPLPKPYKEGEQE